jgi:hypothetical protein
MAKCVGPLHSSEARGKVGGLVYNSWRGFATVKAKHAPAQPRTNLQLRVRSIAIMIARGWADLTNQADWNVYATNHTMSDWTNSPKRLTGANWYVMLHTRMLLAGLTPVNTPPAVNAPDPVLTFTAVGSAGVITMTWTAPTGTDRLDFWLDGLHSAGRQGSIHKAKYKLTLLGSAAVKTITGLAPGVYDVYTRVMSPVDGQVSTWVTARATVT